MSALACLHFPPCGSENCSDSEPLLDFSLAERGALVLAGFLTYYVRVLVRVSTRDRVQEYQYPTSPPVHRSVRWIQAPPADDPNLGSPFPVSHRPSASRSQGHPSLSPLRQSLNPNHHSLNGDVGPSQSASSVEPPGCSRRFTSFQTHFSPDDPNLGFLPVPSPTSSSRPSTYKVSRLAEILRRAFLPAPRQETCRRILTNPTTPHQGRLSTGWVLASGTPRLLCNLKNVTRQPSPLYAQRAVTKARPNSSEPCLIYLLSRNHNHNLRGVNHFEKNREQNKRTRAASSLPSANLVSEMGSRWWKLARITACRNAIARPCVPGQSASHQALPLLHRAARNMATGPLPSQLNCNPSHKTSHWPQSNERWNENAGHQGVSAL
ncbi:hypothetical protein VUR80DRAFT_4770 [Thermomyces stellatus]